MENDIEINKPQSLKERLFATLNQNSLILSNSTTFIFLLAGAAIIAVIAYQLSDATGLNDLRRTFEIPAFFGSSEGSSDSDQYQTRYKRFATNGNV